MGRFVVRVISFIFVYVFLYAIWAYWSDMKLFPHDVIGTGYEVPIPNNHKLIITEIDFGCIEDGEYNTMINRVDSLQIIGDVVIGRDSTDFFSFETNTQRSCYYSSAELLKQAQGIEDYTLLSPIDFYWHHRRVYDIIVNILIAIIAIFCSYYAGKAVISKNKNISKK